MRSQIILDTDMDTDCDDAGALAIAHALADRGECNLLGVICSLPFAECVGAVRAINGWYGRASTPIGRILLPQYDELPEWGQYRSHRERYLAAQHGEPYNVNLTQLVPAALQRCDDDAVTLYRKILGAAADGTITICAIGTLTALAQLLQSGPDAFSDLDGAALVRRKVRELVCMAVAPFPNGHERFNWGMDRRSAATVLRDWPGLLTVSASGDDVLTGAAFIAAAPPEHPVRRAYVDFLGGEGRNRPSWDLIAVLYAVSGMNGPFALSGPRSIQFDAETAGYRWSTFAASQEARQLALPILAPSEMAATLEAMLIDAACPNRG